MNDTERWLLARWLRLGYPQELGELLLEKYGEPHRYYHTAEHLRSMFELLDGMEAPEARRPTLELAIWYHDREYCPRRRDNELRSAVQFLGDAVRLPLGQPERARVVELILLSRDHRPSSGDREAETFCDLDLAVLAGEPAEYAAYAAAIRREHGHYTKGIYDLGRGRVLDRFLGRPRLFQVFTSLEPRARANLRREREGLSPWRRLLEASAPLATAVLLLALGGYLLPGVVALAALALLVLALACCPNEAARVEASVREGRLLWPHDPCRPRLWLTLSQLYLDTQIDPSDLRDEIRNAGYDAGEALQALREVGPVVAGNLGWGILPVIGVWDGFDPDWLRTEVLWRAYARRPPWRVRLEEFFARLPIPDPRPILAPAAER